jgi:hypothetical protein
VVPIQVVKATVSKRGVSQIGSVCEWSAQWKGKGRGNVLEERLDIEIRQMMFFLSL